jgi:GH25 family lysozyme M1 (1,4-beta-N-acetylmuramidase)|nr:MAG TPA: hypothetical protein [Caudoviricetes sp.]
MSTSSVAAIAAAQARYWVLSGPNKPWGGPYSVGYSQPDRLSVYQDTYDGGTLKRDTNADCGTLVMGAINYGLHNAYPLLKWGHPVLFDLDAFWTGNLRGGLEARGFEEVHWDDSALTPDGGLRIGDVVLSSTAEGGVGHVAMVVGDEPTLAEAWIAEDGSLGGRRGDQTGSETRIAPYDTHPDTLSGAWTSCHRFNPARFAAQHPGVAGSAPVPAPQAAPAPAPQSAPPAPPASGKAGPLLGVDISNHQAALTSRGAIDAVNPDFVLVMVSQGDWFTSPTWACQVRAAYDSGRPVGVYHYVDGSGVEAEAQHFVNLVRNAPDGDWNGYVMWCLDWEADQNDAWGDEGYLAALVSRVKTLTGKRIMLYASSGSYPWGVASQHGCGTWVAQYADSDSTGWDYAPWSDGSWTADMHQYTGTGRVPGYDGDLDLDLFSGSEADFKAYYVGAAPASSPAANRSRAGAQVLRNADGSETLAEDGVFGARTIARFQQVMGTTIDGALDEDGSPAVEAFQRYLNTVVGVHDQTAINGAGPLAEDGDAGEHTWRVFQYLVWCWHREYVPSGWGWGDWIDGDAGTATVAALQRALNASTSSTGRLW